MDPSTPTPSPSHSAQDPPLPQLIASTQTLYNGTIASTAYRESLLHVTAPTPSTFASRAQTHGDEKDVGDGRERFWGQESNYFKSCQWSPDGTTLVTTSADNAVRTFVLPPTLLSPPHPLTLTPYPSTTQRLSSPPPALAIHPSYTLSLPPSTLHLLSLPSLPIRLTSPFASPSTRILASYPLIHAPTETYTAPHSLLFLPTSQGATFVAGTDSCVSVFDTSRDGQGPVVTMPTIPSRRSKSVGGGVGFKGIVSALAGSDQQGILAVGTFTRWVGLYDSGGRGGTVGVFEIGGGGEGEGAGAGSDRKVETGRGITQVEWSACGRYLVVVERGSDGCGVWDVRMSGRRLAWLGGRKAESMQRMGVQICSNGEVWAGGTDGWVRVWEGLGMREGYVEPGWGWRAHEDAVSSVVVHPSGGVVATCSGQRHLGEEEEGSEGKVWENSLKVWAL